MLTARLHLKHLGFLAQVSVPVMRFTIHVGVSRHFLCCPAGTGAQGITAKLMAVQLVLRCEQYCPLPLTQGFPIFC